MEAIGAFSKDPLNDVLKEFAYAVVFRDMQINVLRTRLAQLEKVYSDLKDENLRLQEERDRATATKNGHEENIMTELNEHV